MATRAGLLRHRSDFVPELEMRDKSLVNKILDTTSGITSLSVLHHYSNGLRVMMMITQHQTVLITGKGGEEL